MPGCKQPNHTIPLHGANDNLRVEPNTGVPDENPVLFRQERSPDRRKRNAERANIIAIALAFALVAAALYAVFY